jgi:hypothetical protein
VQRLLGEIEIAEETDERGQHPARIGAIDRVDLLVTLTRLVRIRRIVRIGCAERCRIGPCHGDQGAIAQIGRTSMEPNLADGMREAT